MKTKAALLSVLLALVLALTPHVSLSQVRRPQRPARPPQLRDFQRRSEQRRLESQQRSEEFRNIQEQYRDEASQEALGVDADQWKIIKPKMERIRELHTRPTLAFSVYAFAGGGSSSSSSSSGSSRSGPAAGGGRSGVGGGSGGGYAGGSAGGSGGGAGGSVRYGSSGSAGGSGGGASSGFSSGGSSGSGYGYSSGGGAGPKGDRPVKKKVGEMNLGWVWQRPSENKEPDELTEADKTCEQLLDAIEAQKPDRDLVQQRIEQLRQLRQEQRRQLQEAQKQLRDVVTAEVEAKLILMGYLD